MFLLWKWTYRKLWENQEDKTVEIILIMIYSGYRIGELSEIDVDLKKKCFVGGLKTKY